MLDRIIKILSLCDTDRTFIPPTDLYNEGWLLRLVMNWFYTSEVSYYKLSFHDTNAQWYSEALLPSQFSARYRGDKLAESWTNADGVIGHFQIGNRGKGDIALTDNACQFLVLEAKIYSKLSSGVSNALYYDQATRNVACIAETISRAEIDLDTLNEIGFYVLAPKKMLNTEDTFSEYTSKESIKNKVFKRVQSYQEKDGKIKEKWFENWFLPVLKKMEVRCLSWEEIICFINSKDSNFGNELENFMKNA